MSEERIDVQAQVVALCEMFDVQRQEVSQITLEPGDAFVTVFILNQDGHKHINDSGNAVTETRHYRIKT